MFLSLVKLSKKSVQDPRNIHKVLWKLFPDKPDNVRDFLFRIEQWPEVGPVTILMQSVSEPQAPAIDNYEGTLVAIKEVNPKLEKGNQLLFELCAAPTRKDRHSQKRVPIINEEKQIQWLKRQLDDYAETIDVIVSPYRLLKLNAEQKNAHITQITFKGILTVTDPKRLLEKMNVGFGHDRIFGNGLLTISRS